MSMGDEMHMRNVAGSSLPRETKEINVCIY